MNRAQETIRKIIPSIFTLGNLACGIYAMNLLFKSNNLQYPCLLLFIACICDALDGPVARKLNVSSKLGEIFDDIADFFSFGCLPAVFIYHFLHQHTNLSQLVILFLSGFYLFCVGFRLIRFSIQSGHSPFFSGLPSPTAAGILFTLPLITIFKVQAPFFIITIIALTLLMISTLPFLHTAYWDNYPLKQFKNLSFFFILLLIIQLIFFNTTTYLIPEICFLLQLLFLSSPLWIKKFKTPNNAIYSPKTSSANIL